MELASSTLIRGFRCFPARFHTATSGQHQRLPYLQHKFTGYNFASNQVRLQWPSLGAVGADTTAVHNFCTEERVPPFDASDSTSENGEQTKNSEGRDANDHIKAWDDDKMTRVCDKLIDVFMVDMPNPAEWRRLLAFSRDWIDIRPHFFKRCQDRAESEDDPGMKHKLSRLRRKLKEVDEDVQRHNELIKLVKGAPSEIGAIVSRRRKDFTSEFFVHFYALASSYYENPTEQNDLVRLGDMCLAAVENYDEASESIEALNTAELTLKDILNSPVDVACQKIDQLAQKNQFDSELGLMMAKAWSTAQESTIGHDEAKDMMYHLYLDALESNQRRIPPVLWILQYLLAVKDPDELLCALNDAFTPEVEIEGEGSDPLYTTPEELHTLMKTLIDVYHRGRGKIMRKAKGLLRPKTIKKMEELKMLVEEKFM